VSFPLSVDDAFTVGVSFDLLGGFLLGRGLLAHPAQIANRNTHVTVVGSGFNAPEAMAQIEARADAVAGLTSLGVGFLLQAGGYVALVAGAHVETGIGRAALSVVLMLVAAGLAAIAFRRLRWHRILRLTVDVARANPFSGHLEPYPDGQTLLALGRQLGFGFIEATKEGVTPIGPWAKMHFGVEEVTTRYPFDMPAPGRR
jgi:hypothetical protein